MSQSSARLETFTVVSNKEVARNLWKLTIYCPAFASIIKPGQFLNLKVSDQGSELLRIPVSYSDSDSQAGTIEIIYAVVGNGTRAMSAWRSQDISSATGVLGNGWLELNPKGKVLLVAGGCGITPVLGLARYFGCQQIDFDIVIGSRSKEFLYGETESHHAKASQVIVTTDDGSCGLPGFTTTAVEKLLSEQSYGRIYTCGPNIMMKGIQELARQVHIPCEVSLERLMSCGFGVCNTCNVLMSDGSYTRCCTQGPVYMSEEVAW